MLTSALRALINNIFKENFYRKRKNLPPFILVLFLLALHRKDYVIDTRPVH